jgi:hypothetical protein
LREGSEPDPAFEGHSEFAREFVPLLWADAEADGRFREGELCEAAPRHRLTLTAEPHPSRNRQSQQAAHYGPERRVSEVSQRDVSGSVTCWGISVVSDLLGNCHSVTCWEIVVEVSVTCWGIVIH